MKTLTPWSETLKEESMATRKASGLCIAKLCQQRHDLIGGSADLADSTQTKWPDATSFNHSPTGRFIHYGVREFAMFAMMTGIRLHGGLLPYGGTFLVFSDYGKNAIRLAAMMKQQVIFILTHDSIGLGEDGPTHQPVEHLAMLRAMPAVQVWRPADAYETWQGWQSALAYQGPTCLILSRQSLPPLPQHSQEPQGIYCVHEVDSPELIIFATGSEVSLALETVQQTSLPVRVLSCPNLSTWHTLTESQRQQVAPTGIPRLGIEAGHAMSWQGITPHSLSLNHYGVSAPGKQAMAHCGFTVDNVLKTMDTLLHRSHQGIKE